MGSTGDVGAIVPSEAEATARATTQPRPQTVIIKRKGGFWGPIGAAIALCILGWFGAWGWIQYERSAARLALHTQAVHRDASEVQINVERAFADPRNPDPKQLQPGEAALIVSNAEGKRMRVAIRDRQKLTDFQKEMLLFVEGERRRTHALIDAEIERIFADGFADKEESLKRYSEWFFAWTRSWALMREALVAAVSELPKGVSKERTEEAVRHTLTEYLMRHYEQFVLKAELRNGPIERGIEALFHHAHDNYRAMTKQLDLKQQLFLAQHTRHMEDLPDDAVQVTLDWDSQKWKAPRYALEGKALETMRTVGLTGGGAILGRVLWRPIVRRIMAQLGLRVAAAYETSIGGALAGSALEPGFGTVVGGLLGLGVDYAWSKVDEKLNEDDLIAENRKAVDETIALWRVEVKTEMAKAVDIWMDDTEEAVKRANPAADLAGLK